MGGVVVFREVHVATGPAFGLIHIYDRSCTWEM